MSNKLVLDFWGTRASGLEDLSWIESSQVRSLGYILVRAKATISDRASPANAPDQLQFSRHLNLLTTSVANAATDFGSIGSSAPVPWSWR